MKGEHRKRDLRIVNRPIADLKPYPRNARTHTAGQIKKVAESIRRFGWTNPVLVDKDGMIIAGHARVEAAKFLGFSEVPTIALEDLSPEEARAYIIADNRLAEDAGWDWDILSQEIQALADVDFDLSVIGFSEKEIAGLLGNETKKKVRGKAKKEESVDPVTRLGDVWTIGQHRLCCGSALDEEAVEKVTGGKRIRLCITDPPFDMDAFDQMRAVGAAGCSVAVILGGGREWFRLGQVAGWRLHWDAVVVYHGSRHLPGPSRLAPAHNRFGIFAGLETIEGRTDVGLFSRGEEDATGFRRTRWARHSGTSSSVQVVSAGHWGDHPYGKSPDLFRPWIAAFKDMEIWDPFAGSGSVAVAASDLGRAVFMMEIEPRYCDLIVTHLQEYTGKDAMDQNGETFQKRFDKKIGGL